MNLHNRYVILAGPIGSRKTSVLHSTLDHVNRTSQKSGKHIYMIDDPPELPNDRVDEPRLPYESANDEPE